MEIAWRIYERMGFVRSPDLDFDQGELSDYGFRFKMPLIKSNSKFARNS